MAERIATRGAQTRATTAGVAAWTWALLAQPGAVAFGVYEMGSDASGIRTGAALAIAAFMVAMLDFRVGQRAGA